MTDCISTALKGNKYLEMLQCLILKLILSKTLLFQNGIFHLEMNQIEREF